MQSPKVEGPGEDGVLESENKFGQEPHFFRRRSVVFCQGHARDEACHLRYLLEPSRS